MKSDAYRRLCAKATAEAIAEVYGLKRKEAAPSPEPLPQISGRVNVVYNGQAAKSPAYNIGGLTYVPIREIAEGIGATVGWDAESKTATVTRK